MIIHEVEQGTDEWHALRAGIPTASEFSKLVTSTGDESKQLDSYAITLAGEKYAGKPLDRFDGNAWTDRGKQLEAEAIESLSFTHGLRAEKCGFVTTDDGHAGCSPDGLVGMDAVLEVKCLKAENHIKAILYHKKHGRPPTDYVQQTQGQLWVMDRSLSYLLFWHPDLPALVIPTGRDEKVISGIIRATQKVISMRDDVLSALAGG